MRPIHRNCLLVIAIHSLLTTIHAQSPVQDSAIRSSAIANTLRQYHITVKTPSALYNGPEYVEYYQGIHEGHPFLDTVAYTIGSVVYDNILYENLPLKFDIVKNELVLRHPSAIFAITLFGDKINRFTIHGHNFVRIIKDETKRSVATGFYDVLYSGSSIQLLKKETKTVQSNIHQLEGLRRFIEHHIDYYIKTEEGYFPADTRGGLMSALKNKRTDIQQFIRNNKLRFKKDDLELTLVKTAAYYDGLAKRL